MYPYAFRQLLSRESTALIWHLLRLTPEDRQRRFMGTVSEASVRKYATRLDWAHTLVIGFFVEGTLRGVAEVHLADARLPILCEVALTVERAWQDQGVGTELLRRAMLAARNRGTPGLHLQCLSDNYAIQHVAGKFGAHFATKVGESHATLPASPLSFWSLYEEGIQETLGWWQILLDPRSYGQASSSEDLRTALSAEIEQ
jgi:RimJ/RimL family protein N-acetyltransferase